MCSIRGLLAAKLYFIGYWEDGRLFSWHSFNVVLKWKFTHYQEIAMNSSHRHLVDGQLGDE